MPNDASELHRIDKEELVLVLNYRLCSDEQKDTLMYLAREMVRQAKRSATPLANVFLLTSRPGK